MVLSLPTPSSLFLLCLLFFLLHSPPVAADDPLYQHCGNTTASSTYKSSFNRLRSLFSNDSPSDGFSNFSIGQEPDILYGLALCRGDTNHSLCVSCLNNASRDIFQLCPDKIEAVVWCDRCLLRYSNQPYLATTEESEQLTMWNTQNIADYSLFNTRLISLLGQIADEAAYKTPKKFATGKLDNLTADFPTIYGLVQCTPDQSDKQCRDCLQRIFDPMLPQLSKKKGARVLRVHCNFRYEIYPFYDGESMIGSSAPPPVPLVPPLVNPPAPPPVNPDREIIRKHPAAWRSMLLSIADALLLPCKPIIFPLFSPRPPTVTVTGTIFLPPDDDANRRLRLFLQDGSPAGPTLLLLDLSAGEDTLGVRWRWEGRRRFHVHEGEVREGGGFRRFGIVPSSG